MRSTTLRDHRRIIFAGNGYSAEWVEEAARRGLSNYRTTADVLPHFSDEKNLELFTRHGIYTEQEIISRREISLQTYAKTVKTEAKTMIQMSRRDYLPAISAYTERLAAALTAKGGRGLMEKETLDKLCGLCDAAYEATGELETALAEAKKIADTQTKAEFFRDRVIPTMNILRERIDSAEKLTATESWPFPSYGDIMFKI